MLRGNRGVIIAFGLILVSTNHAYAEGQGKQEGAQQSIAASLKDIAAAHNQEAERAQSPDKQAEPCKPGDDRRYSDLCAQWKAADAASDSAWWAWAGGIIGFGSLLGVFFALGLAFHSNWIARDTAKRQLRAYMQVHDCEILLYPEHNEIIMQIRLQNCGQTPAHDVRFMAESFVAPFPMETDRPFNETDPEWSTTVGPGKDISCVRRLFVTEGSVEQAVEQAKTRLGAFYIQGVCAYRDAFNERRETYFRYAFAGTVSDHGLVMQPAKTGNTST